MSFRSTLAISAVAVVAAHARAVVVPFTENFAAGSSNWRTTDSSTPLGWVGAGGPDGSSYASIGFSFLNQSAGGQPSMFRAHDAFDSSGDAFVGDWISSGVTAITLSVRHNTGVSLPFFVRFAPSFAPGAVAVAFAPVPSGAWTSLTVPINPGYPFIYEGTTFGTTFNNIGRVQIGVEVPAGLAGNAASFTFDIDRVSLVPGPGAAGLTAALAGLGTGRRRRNGQIAKLPNV
jgi:hypothetical protein